MRCRGLVLAVVLLLNAGAWWHSSSGAESLQVGRYQFIAAGGGAGYRLDTATGELYQIFVNGERLIWKGIEGASAVGRFDVIPRRRLNDLGVEMDPASWYLVDTATGHVWHVSPSGTTYVGDPNRL